MLAHASRALIALSCLLLLAACGGGGSGDSSPPSGSPPPAPAPPPAPPPVVKTTAIELKSDPGDYIGQGRNYAYTLANSEVKITAQGAVLGVAVSGDESWSGQFQLPSSNSRIVTGTFNNLTRYPFNDPAIGGLNWSGEGRGCNTLAGTLTINEVVYNGTTLTRIDLSFEQYCGNSSPALRGTIYWDAGDTTTPPGPVVPPPAGLWSPAPGVTPATGNYIYLESQAGDYIGQGRNYLYTGANSLLAVSAANARLSVSVNGDERWFGDFQAMNVVSDLRVGYYGSLLRYPFHNPVRGGLNWSGEGRGCNTLTGWFVIDSLAFSGGALAAISLRFEQYCDGTGPALRGAIRWDASDPTAAPGPVVPPPAGLWAPAAGITGATGNYVYLESEAGDYIGQGRDYLYTGANSVITIDTTGARLVAGITGDERWIGDFQPMISLARLEVGYYGDLQRFPFHNPVKGGLGWGGQGRGCNRLTGWFVDDSVTYSGDTLMAVTLRFEQHCEGEGPALRGAIRWDVNDPTTPPGPVVPPPAGLWAPAPGTTPATGNYVYLESEAWDYIGQGRNYLYTGTNSVIRAFTFSGRLVASIIGDERWTGDFQPMNSVTRLEPGYYGDLRGYPFHNPAKGGLYWSGQGRACNTVTGWFVIDSLSFSGETLTAVTLRFEQHCGGGGPALRGAIRWDVNDPTTPPGPVVPPPAGLWEPAPGATPATGNYVYIESQPGDYIGQGRTYLHTAANSVITVGATGARLRVDVVGDDNWSGNFQAMDVVTRLEPGYYGGLQHLGYHNPTKGGLDWGSPGRGCNTLTGWVVVDSVAYSGDTLTAITMRFEQHCEGLVPALRGKIRWSQ